MHRAKREEAAIVTPAEGKHAAASKPEKVAPLVAEPPLPDDPGPDAEEAMPRKRFRFLDWLAGPAA
jgi:hypothetical protein